MESKVNIDIKALKFLYERHKEFTIPGVVIFTCIIILIKFIVPQFQDIFTLSNDAKTDSRKVVVLKNNINLLSRLDDSTLDSQVKIVSLALPTNKDFIGIINSISYASSIAGVSVGDFQLNIGNLSQEPTDTSKFSSISLNLSVDGSIDDINKFIQALYATLPISEVTSINLGSTSSNVAINFYYKPLPPVSFSESTPINTIKNTAITLINDLSNFNYNFSSSFEPIDGSLESITPL